MKQRMSRKGLHFMNFAETLILALCIVIGLLALSFATNLEIDKAERSSALFEGQYHTEQLLRTFSQTSIVVEEEVMSVSSALNKYFEIETLEQPSSAQKNYQRALQQEIDELLVANIGRYIGTRTKNSIVAVLYKNDVEVESLELYDEDSPGVKNKNPVLLCTGSIQLPAYFTHETARPGSYYITLDFVRGDENERARDKTGGASNDC